MIISMALHRSRTRNLPVSIYNRKVDMFNQYMGNMLVKERASRSPVNRYKNQGLWWWKHQKLMKHPPLMDGVHLVDFPGQKRLYRSIRLAVLEAHKAYQLIIQPQDLKGK